MSHCAERVANLVGDAAGQPAEGGHFQVLGPLTDRRVILKEQQYAAAATVSVVAG